MYILGINAYHGDSSACLIKDGNIVCAIEEERIRRVKHWAGFPSESIKFCLMDQRITINDVDYITISRNSKANLLKKTSYLFTTSLKLSVIFDRFKNLRKVNSVKQELANLFSLNINEIKAKVYNIEHHRSHIASAFFASSFSKSAILSVDGFGDFTSTMTAIGNNNKFKIINQVNYPHSLGLFYTTLTQFLGFLNYGDEYKVMGLAPYGEPKYLDQMEKIVNITNNGLFRLNKNYFKHFNDGVAMEWNNGIPSIEKLYTKYWINLFGFPRRKQEKINQKHKDLAASAQKLTENVIFHLLNQLYIQTGCENICITGGVAQNSVANGKILQNTKFKKIYVPSAGHDAGTAIGGALYLYNQILNQKRRPEIKSSYFGSCFSNKDIINVIQKNNVEYNEYKDDELFDIVTNKIIEGGVVGWFQGRAEFGPRALGHRSILVDPRRKDAKQLLNEKIKKRESFRPFAPSILEDYVDEYFEQSDRVYFMEKVFKIQKNKQSKIPAVTHIDGTGRLQTVSDDTCPKFYKLISVFYQKTGIPLLLNTSFNENEPIVNTPNEALDCFLRTNMDMLVMENIIIKR